MDDIKKEIETIKSQISPEALSRRELLVQLITVAFELVGAHPQAYFGGTTLIGKDCERICRHSEEFTRSIQRGLEALLRRWLQPGPTLDGVLDEIESKFDDLRILLGVVDQVFSLLRVPRRLTDGDIENLKDALPLFIGYWGKLFADKDDGQFSSLPIKVHVTADHVVEFITLFGFAGAGSDDAGEVDIHEDKVDSRGTQASNHNFKAQQKQNFARRKLRYDPQQIAQFKKAIELTVRGEKAKSTLKRKAEVTAKIERRADAVESAKKGLQLAEGGGGEQAEGGGNEEDDSEMNNT